MRNKALLKRDKRRRNPYPKRGYTCKHCGSGDHYSYTCFQRPMNPIQQQSPKHKRKYSQLRSVWFTDNPAPWKCYLNISPDCPRLLNAATIQLEHVRSRTRHPALAFSVENIKPACQPCNKLKQSWDIAQLAETYPHIFAMITTPEWQAYEKTLDQLEGKI